LPQAVTPEACNRAQNPSHHHKDDIVVDKDDLSDGSTFQNLFLRCAAKADALSKKFHEASRDRAKVLAEIHDYIEKRKRLEEAIEQQGLLESKKRGESEVQRLEDEVKQEEKERRALLDIIAKSGDLVGLMKQKCGELVSLV
jgi:hypothetical protein